MRSNVEVLDFALKRGQQYPGGKRHFYGGKCEFVLDPCKGYLSMYAGDY